MQRRLFLFGLGAALVPARTRAAEFEPWRPGCLDIHHISTGRGNAALLLCPDGTTLMIDAGAVADDPAYQSPARPDGSRRPGEWIGRYVRRQIAAAGRDEIDALLLTHFHPDHMDGIPDVAGIVPIRRLVDRNFPGYDYPQPVDPALIGRYRGYVAQREARGELTERFRPGSADQIVLQRDAAAYPEFQVRNLVANGEVWTGRGAGTRPQFPDPRTLAAADYPDENMCSLALRLSYGAFRYYSGGDLTCDTRDGASPWRDVETPVARACGAVSVASVDHHGYYDAAGPGFVRALRPRAFVIPAWHVTHPALSVLERLFSRRLYPGDRDVFATTLAPASKLVNARFASALRSDDGHVVVRVDPGGASFRVEIVDDRDESGRVTAAFGPYAA